MRRGGSAFGLALGLAVFAAEATAPLAVHLRQDGPVAVLRLRLPYGVTPELGWSGSNGPAPYVLWVEWPDAAAVPAMTALPQDQGPIESSTLTRRGARGHLEFRLRQPVTPWLRQSGDGWDLRLIPAIGAATAPGSPASKTPAAPVLPPASPPIPTPPLVAMPAPQAARQAETPSAPEQLLVDFTVNGQRQPEVVLAERTPDGRLLIAADKWAEARLRAPEHRGEMSDGTPAYAVDAVPGAQYRLDALTQSLALQVPAAALEGSTLSAQARLAQPPPRPAAGLTLTYDINETRTASAPASRGATLEAVAFGGFGTVVTSALVRHDAGGREATRLDSYWRYDLPHRLESVVVGDTVGVGGGWSRPVRYGGLRWGRDFGLRPGFVTTPLPSLSGQAALPSTVEVLVNNARSVTQAVQPGPFDVQNIPVVSGAGELNLVVRDLLGRETVIRQSYYASPELLAPGLSDFSVETGWMRTGYGHDSHYVDPFFAWTWRRGASASVTGEWRLEAQADRQAAGVEVAGLLGTWGLGRAAVAASRHRADGLQENGHLVQLGFERRTLGLGTAIQYEYATSGFTPFGEASAALRSMRSREQWLANVGGRMWRGVGGGLSYVRQLRWDGDLVESVGLSLGFPVGGGASLNLSALKRLDVAGAWSGLVTLSVPLSDGTHVGSTLRREDTGQLVGAATATRNPPAGPGVGWRVEASTLAAQRARAGVQYNSEHAEWRGDVATDAAGRASSRLNASGTLGYMAGVPFASRPVGERSFAVVQVDGVAGVPVKRSNQLVARTDARGLAFVPNLVPWYRNVIEIDPQDLPLDAEIKDARREVVPYARSGVLVRFDVRRTRQALLVLEQPDGRPVPVGAIVKLLPEGPEFSVAHRGEAWLTDLPPERQRIRVHWPDGACELELDLSSLPSDQPGDIGPLVCGR